MPAPDSDAAIDDAGATAFEIHRLKARLSLSNGDIKIVQGVREVFEIVDVPRSDDSTPGVVSSSGKVVLIGRNLQGVPFEESFFNTINS